MKNKENISLIGMPAVGKSTVGLLMAEKLGFNFIDSDDIICSKERQTLSQIIEAQGLEGFLDVEENHILGLNCRRHVIATGGSVVYRENAMAHLAGISTIVYLSVDLPTLLTRLDDPTARGVAITPGKRIEDLYKERTPLYDAFCDIKINCRTLTADEVSQKALDHLELKVSI